VVGNKGIIPLFFSLVIILLARASRYQVKCLRASETVLRPFARGEPVESPDDELSSELS
jgi:hypothetical protein